MPGERELYLPRRWLPTRRLARAWWYCNGTPTFWDRHPGLDWNHPLDTMRVALDDRVSFFEWRVPWLAWWIRLLVEEARDDFEIGYVGVAIVEDAAMSTGRKAIEAVYRARLEPRSRDLVLNAMYASYRTGDFQYIPGLLSEYVGPWWWHPIRRARLRSRNRHNERKWRETTEGRDSLN